MVILGLVFMARTQNVQEVFMPEQADWHAVIKCSNCHQNFPKQVTFNNHQTVEMTKQHGTAHFGATCKNCDSKCYITIDQSSTYKAKPNEDGLIKETILKLDCRRCEVVKVNLGNSMTVKCSNSPTVFQNADFTDLWCEMDEQTNLLVQVEDPRIEIVAINDKK